MALAGILQAALPYLPTLIAATQAARAVKKTPAEMAQEEQLRQQQYYTTQAADPNSELMKRYGAANEANNRRDFAATVEQLLNSNRRQTQLGRTPLFNGETADQDIWRAGQLGYVDAQRRSTEQAHNDILGLATGAGNAATGYGNMVKPQQQRNQGYADLTTQIGKTGTDILQKILQKQQAPAYNPVINWNS